MEVAPPVNSIGYFFTKPFIKCSGQVKSFVSCGRMIKNVE